MSNTLTENAPKHIPAAKRKGAASITGLLLNRFFLYAVSIVMFLAVWDVVALYKLTGSFLPRPLEVMKQLLDLMVNPLAGKTLFEHLWASLQRVLIAFVIAVLVGVPIGVLMAMSKYANAVIKPIFDLFKPMPPIAWISLAILWFGINETSKVFIIIIGAIVPCIINSYNGIRLVDHSLCDAIRILGANRRQEIREVIFPASFPAIFAGIQISLSMAWTTVLAAELVGAREGMGFIIITGMNLTRPALIISGMIVIAVTAWLISVGVSYLERWVCPWRAELKQ